VWHEVAYLSLFEAVCLSQRLLLLRNPLKDFLDL
jgi:hypothetical protein